MASYAVGDIQGCLRPLQQLLEQVDFGSGSDTLWIVGDLVNRGPESLAALRFAHQLGPAVKMVLGNHDLHLLAAAAGHKKLGGKDTLAPILEAPDRDQLLHWLQQQALVYSDPALGYTMVHAGIPPIWSVADALARAREVEQVLRGDNAGAFFAAMYGNQPDCWRDDLSGGDRLRLITNYFTRMRFCSADGRLELKTKTGPENAPPGYRPWFAHPNHRCASSKILFGHWASLLGATTRDNFIGLDTGCVWGGALSMIRLDDGARFKVDCRCQAGGGF